MFDTDRLKRRLLPGFLELCVLLFLVGGPGIGQDETSGADRTNVSSVPLPDRAGGRGMLFQDRPPNETGLRHTNPLQLTPSRWFYFGSSFAGGGVAIGDYDRDGRPDVFVTGHLTDSKLFRQTAAFQFENVTGKAGLETRDRWSSGASFVDLNDDGWLDLYLCNYMSPNQLYINQGDGTFTEQAAKYHLDLNRPSVTAVFADYDRDGDLDLYLLTWRKVRFSSPVEDCETVGSGDRLRVKRSDRNMCQVIHPAGREPVVRQAGYQDHLLRNDGDLFIDVTERAGLVNYDIGNDASWIDYNRDGWPDLYVANDHWDPDRLYRNDGDGTFTEVTERAVPHIPFSSMGIASGDLTGNGFSDLVATDMAGVTHQLRKKTMTDDKGDFWNWFVSSRKPLQYFRNSVYLNSTPYGFREAAFLTGMARTSWTWSVKIRDLNNSGRSDVYFTTGMTRSLMDRDYHDRSRKLYRMYRDRDTRSSGQERGGIMGGADSKLARHQRDLFKQAPSGRRTNLVFRNRGDLRFERGGGTWGLEEKGISFGAAFADLDRDGDLDLVTNNLGDPVGVYENTGASHHRVLIRLKGRKSNSYGVGARVTLVTSGGRQVRYHNPYEGFMSADEPLLHVGLGEREQIQRGIIRWPSGTKQVLRNLRADRFYMMTEPAGDGPQGDATGAEGRGHERSSLFTASELGFTHS